MSEYTPTTDDVREVWVEGQDITWGYTHEYHADEFDRWLAEHDRAVAERAWDECSKARKYGIKHNPYRKES